MFISYAVHYMSATHTHDLYALFVFLRPQIRIISAYFIEGLVCTAILGIIGINGCIISDR